MDCHSLLQGIFLAQRLNMDLLHDKQILYHLSYQGSHSVRFSLVAESCPTLSITMDCSMSGFPVHHQLPELTQTYVLSQWCHPTSSSCFPFSSCLQSFLASGSFPVGQFFASGGQSVGVSASASVLPMHIQDWFTLGLTGWIPCCPRDS